jgi:hypothetical protein
MIDELQKQDHERVRARINAETARIPWCELQRFFAAGKVFHVDAELDLVEVACALHEDDIERVRGWTEAAQLGPVADERARNWLDCEASLWAVVVKPWVLVQEAD